MNFNEYQELAGVTSNRDLNPRDHLAQNALGIAGEAGECADMIKKHLYHKHPLDKAEMIKELGDVLWYLSQLAGDIGVGLEEVAETNIAKLKARYPEGFSAYASLNRVL